ncbi:peptidase inhibitor I78 [Phenylobacterium sp.]|uniref:peptidase inhibitor I78 n=1 Tax=Phenylobacterium sp. TaxID=1871053 RepID=UPI0035615C7F
MRPRGGLVLALLLAGCAAPSYPVTPPPAESAPTAPQPPPRRSPIRPPQVSVRDQCDAATHQGLIGRPRTEIPIPIDPDRQRVACTTCPVTLDYRADRLNFFFDAETGIIKQVRCG